MFSFTSIKRTDLLRYGVLALPLAFAGMPLYIHAPDFYATQYGISLGTLGLVLLAIRAIDALQDPLIGMLSDYFFAYRKTIILVGAVLLGLGFFLLFHPAKTHTTAWFAVSMIVATTAFSILSINLNALGGTWTSDKNEKTRITSYREAFGLIGLLIASTLPSVLQNRAPADEAYHLLTFIFLGLLSVCVFLFVTWIFQHKEFTLTSRASFFASFSAQHTSFFTIYGLSMLASAIPAVLVIFFIRDRLEGEAYTGLFLLLYFLSGVVGMPLWQRLAKKYGKDNAWFFAMLLAIVTFVWAFFLNAGDLWQYALICVGSGMALGAELALPPSILADLLEEKQSFGNASGHFSILAFLAKASLALASGITFSLLAYAGYQPGKENSSNALLALSLSYALIPCITKCLAAGALWHWKRKLHQGGFYAASVDNFSGEHRNA